MVRLLRFLSASLAILVLARSFNFFPEIGIFYYYFYFTILATLVFIGGIRRLDFGILLILCASFASIVFNDVDQLFRPYDRLLAFAALLALVSPLISSNCCCWFRYQLFLQINEFITWSVVVSLVAIVVGVPFSSDRSGYVGLFSHSMLLGPFSAISAIFAIRQLHGETTSAARFRYYFVVAASLMACVASGSRSALVSGFLGIMTFYVVFYRFRLFKIVRVLIVFSCLVLVSTPIWLDYSENLLSKIQYSEERGGIFFSREVIWNNRLEEFLSSPIIGVGFSSTQHEDDYDSISGVVEPGSSWLGVASMTGVIGFFAFLFVSVKFLRIGCSSSFGDRERSFSTSMLTFFFLHFAVEGYVFAAGSALCFYFWLLLGFIDGPTRQQPERGLVGGGYVRNRKLAGKSN